MCKNEKKVIDNLEQSFDSIIRFNKEREEKERLLSQNTRIERSF